MLGTRKFSAGERAERREGGRKEGREGEREGGSTSLNTQVAGLTGCLLHNSSRQNWDWSELARTARNLCHVNSDRKVSSKLSVRHSSPIPAWHAVPIHLVFLHLVLAVVVL